MKEATFVFSPSFQTYQFHQDHPFNQLRVYLTYDLLQKMKALTDDEIVAPRMATLEELKLVHTADYIQAVQRASEGKLSTTEGNVMVLALRIPRCLQGCMRQLLS